MNRIYLIGKLTKNPEYRIKINKKIIVRFKLAYYADNKRYKVNYINCLAWNKPANKIIKECKKNSKIMLVGSLQTSKHKNEYGNTVFKDEIVVDDLILLKTKNQIYY